MHGSRAMKRQKHFQKKHFEQLISHDYGVRGAIGVRADELLSETPIIAAATKKGFTQCMNIGCGCTNVENMEENIKNGEDFENVDNIENTKDNVEDIEGFENIEGINILETEDDPLMNADEDGYVMLELTGDTGAVDHVMSPDEVPGQALKESPGSKAGRGFLGPAGERIDNLGQLELDMQTEETGQQLYATFQAADVTRALMSISKICDSGEGTKVVFDSKQGVVTRQGREMARFHRKGGLYVMRVKVKTDGNAKKDSKIQPRGPEQGFTRPGGKELVGHPTLRYHL